MTSHDFLYSLFSIRTSDVLRYALCLLSCVVSQKKKESPSRSSHQVDLALQQRLHCESLRQDAFQHEDSIRRHGGIGSNCSYF